MQFNELKDINNFFSTAYQLRSAVRTVLREEFNVSRRRTARQVQIPKGKMQRLFFCFQTDRTDALLGNFNGRDSAGSEHPLHTPSGEKTRKTYDFTRTHHVGTSCHDIQATQGATKSGVYLIHPPNLAQGPWKVGLSNTVTRLPTFARCIVTWKLREEAGWCSR